MVRSQDSGVNLLAMGWINDWLLARTRTRLKEGTEPPIQWVQGDSPQGVKETEQETCHSVSCFKVRMSVILPLCPLYAFMASISAIKK